MDYQKRRSKARFGFWQEQFQPKTPQSQSYFNYFNYYSYKQGLCLFGSLTVINTVSTSQLIPAFVGEGWYSQGALRIAVCAFKCVSVLVQHSEIHVIDYRNVWSNLSDFPVDLKRHHMHIFVLLLLFSRWAAAEKVIYVFLHYKLCSSTIITPGSLMSQAFV